jgi:hypothetical protein
MTDDQADELEIGRIRHGHRTVAGLQADPASRGDELTHQRGVVDTADDEPPVGVADI